MKLLLDIVNTHKTQKPVGIYSVCSAHPLVIKATLLHAKSLGQAALIEATSNQVNQDGGYTGMTPLDFSNLVLRIADDVGMDRNLVLLGGDHLGPNCWQSLPAETAMAKSEKLIYDYVAAGFKKIHLDCSMSCAGDPVPLTDHIVAARAARLCKVAEMAWKTHGGEPPVYIVGTEVPVPGGATEDLNELAVTLPTAAEATIAAHKSAFEWEGLQDAWPRVVGLVVQPGVEFDHDKVVDYISSKARELSASIQPYTHMVFEAHSTDYQLPANLKGLVESHFAILKVGPGVTYAMREAIWALDALEQEWLGKAEASCVKDTILGVMNDEPRYWQSYYHGKGRQLDIEKQFSFSDRIRYYWPHKKVVSALNRMKENFKNGKPPLTLLSQFLPAQFLAVREGKIPCQVEEIVIHKIQEVLSQYSDACMQ